MDEKRWDWESEIDLLGRCTYGFEPVVASCYTCRPAARPWAARTRGRRGRRRCWGSGARGGPARRPPRDGSAASCRWAVGSGPERTLASLGACRARPGDTSSPRTGQSVVSTQSDEVSPLPAHPPAVQRKSTCPSPEGWPAEAPASRGLLRGRVPPRVGRLREKRESRHLMGRGETVRILDPLEDLTSKRLPGVRSSSSRITPTLAFCPNSFSKE